MTAVNFIRKDRTAYLITDGMVLDNGAAAQARTKVLLLPHLQGALALRGFPVLLGSLHSIINHCHASFDSAAAGLGDALRTAWEPLRDRFPLTGPQQAFLAGFPDDPDAPPRCACASSVEECGREPYAVAMCSAVLGPNDGSLATRLGRDVTDPATAFEPELDAVALIDAQRQMPGSGVGAFVQVTTLRHNNIGTRILKLN